MFIRSPLRQCVPPPTPPHHHHHHPESPLKKPSRILTARIQATLNRLTSCALAASGEIVWNGEEIQASPQKNKRRSKYSATPERSEETAAEWWKSNRLIFRSKATRLWLKTLTSGFLSILCCPSIISDVHAQKLISSQQLAEAAQTNQAECVFSHFSQAFKMTCAADEPEKSRRVFSLAPNSQSERCSSRDGKPSA